VYRLKRILTSGLASIIASIIESEWVNVNSAVAYYIMHRRRLSTLADGRQRASDHSW
jgi:hypothetical protein